MADKIQLVIDADSSAAVKGLRDTESELKRLESSAQSAARGFSPLAARMEALSSAQGRAASSAQELAASHRQLVSAAGQAAGRIGELNQKLANLRIAKEHARQLTSEVDRLGSSLLAVGGGMLAGQAFAGAGFAKSAVELAAERMAVEQALASITGSQQTAQTRLGQLKEAAKQPGIDFGPAATSMMMLEKQVGGTQGLRIIREFGNAAAFSANQTQAFEGSLRGLTQMLGKGKVSTQELQMQILENSPLVGDALETAFGTRNAEAIGKMDLSMKEFIERLLAGMEQLPRAADGAANALVNFRTATQEAQIAFGKGLLGVDPAGDINDVTAALERFEPEMYKAGEAVRPLLENGARLVTWLLDTDSQTAGVTRKLILFGPAAITAAGAVTKLSVAVNTARIAKTLLAKEAGVAATKTTLLGAATTGLKGAVSAAAAALGTTTLGVGAAAAAVVGLGIELYQLARSWSATRDAIEGANRSLRSFVALVDDAQSRGYVTGQQAAQMKPPTKKPWWADWVPWRTKYDDEIDKWANTPAPTMARALPGRSVREEVEAEMRARAGASTSSGGGGGFPAPSTGGGGGGSRSRPRRYSLAPADVSQYKVREGASVTRSSSAGASQIEASKANGEISIGGVVIESTRSEYSAAVEMGQALVAQARARLDLAEAMGYSEQQLEAFRARVRAAQEAEWIKRLAFSKELSLLEGDALIHDRERYGVERERLELHAEEVRRLRQVAEEKRRAAEQAAEEARQKRLTTASERTGMAELMLERGKLVGLGRAELEQRQQTLSAAKLAEAAELARQGHRLEAMRAQNEALGMRGRHGGPSLANAILGGDAGQVADLLQVGRQASGGLNLDAVRRPDLGRAGRQISEAIQERDVELLRHIASLIRGAGRQRL